MSLSIIIPTYRESLNIEPLTVRIAQALEPAAEPYEIIFVDDDSDDSSEQVADRLAKSFPVRFICRKQTRGLATAVMTGVYHATGDVVVVMDADLSHPPEAIPQMLQLIRNGDSDFVLGSRFLKYGSSIKGWSLFRYLNSLIATFLARPLMPLSDPMSGFFAFPACRIPAPSTLSPIGFKIGLEIYVKGDFQCPSEIPICFTNRVKGKSKLTLLEQFRYLRHLHRLYHYKYPFASEIVQFAMVGSSGLVIDISVFLFLEIAMGINHYLARGMSFFCAASSNWLLNRLFTFSYRQKTSKLPQWTKFTISSLTSFSINFGSYVLLTKFLPFFSQHYLLALLTGVALGFGANFMLSHWLIFKPYK